MRPLDGITIFLLTWGFWALGSKKYLCQHSKWVLPSQNCTKIDWDTAKTEIACFHSLLHLHFGGLENAIKMQVFDQKKSLFWILRRYSLSVSSENQGGCFFMKNPLTHLGVPKNIQKVWIFSQKHAFFFNVFESPKMSLRKTYKIH